MPPPSSRRSNPWFDSDSRTVNALITAAWLFTSLAAVAFAGMPRCRVCDNTITGKFHYGQDKARGGQYEICSDCMKLETRCFACGVPVKSAFTTLLDGRCL